MDDLILFLPVFVGLTVLNLKNCDRVLPFLLLQALILVCTVVSGYLSSFLYYHLISDDYLTPVIGELFVLLEVAVNVIVTPIAAIFKAVVKKIQPSK